MTDSFDNNYCHKDFELSANNLIASKIKTGDSGDSTVFLQKAVDSGIHQWTFKLKQTNKNVICIGVWNGNMEVNAMPANISVPAINLGMSTSGWAKHRCYGYVVTSNFITYGANDKLLSYGPDVCKTGDVIDMILDLNKLELRYIVNNNDYGVAHTVKRASYKAFVSGLAYKMNISVELLSYKQIKSINGNNENDDTKCNQCDLLLEQTITLKQTNQNMRSEIDRLKQKNAEINNKYQQIKLEKSEWQKINITLREENTKINKSNIKLNEECKQLQTDLNQMTDKYKKILRKPNIVESNYMNWDNNDITDWIVNLSQEYVHYEPILRKNIQKEQVDGSLLNKLDKNDLHRLGINSLKHKIEIIKHIKRLITNKKLPILPQNDEGVNDTVFI